ncbi:MAG: carbohydrate ABC transporter permease [Bacilli bacterium]|jgi:multiple sugar transport system permease protein|nr:carbohydrate ABC transporter permease [Bacilli bacterium]MCH4210675.1 carbohydrate ABC transporter permease [Bacilli bacterium]MCH4228610.1 carbohydrate ABC transporter permease [Bacilli bacterium]MCH4277735.1 carbohydrate ABC transporter permease [Bacilli bacterium]MCI2054850.1 carbohydrate ABC transporter permease [Bacilli bacterium]
MATYALPKKITKSYKAQLIVRRVLVYAVLILLSFLCIFPLYTLIVNMTRSHGDISANGFSFWFGNNLAANWDLVFNNAHLPVATALVNSIIVSTLSSIIAVYFSTLTAFSFNVYNFKGKSFLFTFVLLIMMIPTQVSALGFVRLMNSWHATNQLWPLIIPNICAPVVFFYINQYMQANLPYELIEASRVDGSSEVGIFHKIVIPLMKPAIAVQFIFTFVSSWNNYFVPALLIDKDSVKTLPLVIATIKASDPSTFNLGQVYCLIGVSIIPLIIVYLIFSRFIIKGMTEGAVKG